MHVLRCGSSPRCIVIKRLTSLTVGTISIVCAVANPCVWESWRAKRYNYFQILRHTLHFTYLCWQYTRLHGRCICIGHPPQRRQWHRSRTGVLMCHRTLRHQRCWGDRAQYGCLWPLPSSVAQCCGQSWWHSDVPRVRRKQRFRHATARCHCIRWCKVLEIHLRLFPAESCQAAHMCYDTWHYSNCIWNQINVFYIKI